MDSFDFLIQIVNEIELHRSLNHPYVVGFHGFFEDNKNVYILLELCARKVSAIKWSNYAKINYYNKNSFLS